MLIILTMLGLCLFLFLGVNPRADFQVIRVIWTSDLHSQVNPTPDFAAPGLPRRELGGWEGLSTLIKEIRTPATLLVDAGDFGFGSPEGDSAHGRLAIWLMNRLGYDAAVLGARDFTAGLANLEICARYADFPLLFDPMLDVLLNRRVPLFRPYLIKEVAGIKVGIIGLADPDIPLVNRRTDISGLVVDEPLLQVRRFLPALRSESAEVIIVLGHITVAQAREIAESVPGLDLIIAAGAADRVESQLPRKGTALVVAGGVYGQRVGVADILFHKKERRVYAVEAQVLNVIPAQKPDSVIRGRVLDGLDSVVAFSDEEFVPDSAGRVRLGLVVAEAVSKKVDADIVVLPSGVIEAGLTRGKLTYRQLYNAVPYRERLRVVALPETLLDRCWVTDVVDSGFPAPVVGGADLFVTGDTLRWPRLYEVAGFRLRDRRKGVYRLVTTESWLEQTGVEDRGRVLPEDLTGIWLGMCEKYGQIETVPGPRLYPATPGMKRSEPRALININTAPIDVLCQLPGIGPKTAERIIEYRQTRGRFRTVEEIMNVRGIGPKKFEQIKNLITVR